MIRQGPGATPIFNNPILQPRVPKQKNLRTAGCATPTVPRSEDVQGVERGGRDHFDGKQRRN